MLSGIRVFLSMQKSFSKIKTIKDVYKREGNICLQ